MTSKAECVQRRSDTLGMAMRRNGVLSYATGQVTSSVGQGGWETVPAWSDVPSSKNFLRGNGFEPFLHGADTISLPLLLPHPVVPLQELLLALEIIHYIHVKVKLSVMELKRRRNQVLVY